MPKAAVPSDFLKRFRALVKEGRRFLVASHVRPDGDAYGSTLALTLSLRKAGKTATAWNPDGLSERFAWLPGAAGFAGPKLPQGPWDVRIVVDTASPDRVGDFPLASDPASPVVNLDHHGSNPGFGDCVWVDAARAACGEMVFDLLREADLPVDRDIASCLFVAISTDTGSFRFSNTRAATLRAAAELLDAGAEAGELSRMIWENEPARRLAFLREILPTARFEEGGKVGLLWIRSEAYARSGAQPEDTEGVIDFVRSVAGVVVGLVFEEAPGEIVRVSFRSKDPRVDVAKLAVRFGGGGHAAAAGARISGAPAAVEREVLAAVKAAL
ncbi:MAG: bifunctional oligoribonuclease/PAP phosphatase NrnA [Verrucomicrobiae bacterium]|nr:bifunctional oligoribonuclease/PAP phosphatase NrnA [Verrucomicrobiae bacterium]